MSSAARLRSQSVFREIGDFGRSQMLHLSLLALPVTIYAAISLSYVFTASDLTYRCKIPGCDYDDKFERSWLADAFPLQSHSDQFERCIRYKALETHLGMCTRKSLFDKNSTEGCYDGFVYTTEELTVVNKFNVTCDSSEFLLPLAGSVNNLGLTLFLPIAGIISDEYGRRKTFVWSIFMVGLVGVCKAFAPWYWLFLALEFVGAALGSAAFSAAFLLGIEMVGKSGRAFASSALTFFEAIGHVLLGYLAYYLQNYEYLLLCLHIPCICVLSYLWLVPESIPWLLSKRYNEAAAQQITDTARHNGQTLSKTAKEKIGRMARRVSRSISQPPKEGSMFRSGRLLYRMCLCAICWTCIVLVDLSLTLCSLRLAGDDKYNNFIDVVLMEVPANILSFVTLDYLSRKWPISLFALAGGGFCAANIWFMVPYEKWLVVAAKLCTSVAYNNLYVFTVELFPTTGRNTVICLCSMAGRVGAIWAPHMVTQGLGVFNACILSGCGVVCALGVWLLPETWMSKMPENVEEAEDIGRNRRKSIAPDDPSEKTITLSAIEEISEN